MSTANSQLALHVLLYAIHALAEGDLKAIEDLDFTVDEVQQLSQLPIKALKHLARLSGHFMAVKTDHDCFAKVIAHLNRELENDTLQDELLRHQAPIIMMNTLFGMSTTEYIQRQKVLGIPRQGAGRPPLPSDDEQAAIWHSWVKTEGLSLPQRYLEVACETDLPLRALWSLIQSWDTALPTSNKPSERKPGTANTTLMVTNKISP